MRARSFLPAGGRWGAVVGRGDSRRFSWRSSARMRERPEAGRTGVSSERAPVGKAGRREEEEESEGG